MSLPALHDRSVGVKRGQNRNIGVEAAVSKHWGEKKTKPKHWGFLYYYPFFLSRKQKSTTEIAGNDGGSAGDDMQELFI